LPIVKVTGATGRPIRVVERVLRGSPGSRGDRVAVVPGGHRPGQPDHAQRDRARAMQPIQGPARVVVLGCTASAGQTVTTLLAGQVLATLRGEPVAVLDLNPGSASLTEQAKAMPRLLTGHRVPGRMRRSDDSDHGEGRGLQVVTAGEDCQQEAGSLIDAAAARFPLALADPAARSVPACMQVADQLVLVAPASAEAAGSLAMTLEWLGAHGHDRLASDAIIVLTGVSPPSVQHADKAAAVASGRCRAVVRVPWDERLAAVAGPAAANAPAGPRPLGADAVRAYTELAGVLVSALADADTAAASPR
jgi:MinD-like ATPase involved in chromosome partitioning or flagellar assembly